MEQVQTKILIKEVQDDTNMLRMRPVNISVQGYKVQGQYTGLRDNNSNRIFDGDKIKANKEDFVYIGVVKYNPRYARYELKYMKEGKFRHAPLSYFVKNEFSITHISNFNI